MKKVINIPRIMAKEWKNDPGDCAWVSISEPGEPQTMISNLFLDKLPTLHIALWDLEEPIKHEGKTLWPMGRIDTLNLFNFLIKNKDKSIIVNCAAGISRSGAVARFCEDYLGYEWMDLNGIGKSAAMPNRAIYRMLAREYENRFEEIEPAYVGQIQPK